MSSYKFDQLPFEARMAINKRIPYALTKFVIEHAGGNAAIMDQLLDALATAYDVGGLVRVLAEDVSMTPQQPEHLRSVVEMAELEKAERLKDAQSCPHKHEEDRFEDEGGPPRKEDCEPVAKKTVDFSVVNREFSVR